MSRHREYIDALFDAGENVCFGKHVSAKDVMPVEFLYDESRFELPTFISVNPFHLGTTRQDESVSVFRSFLVEIDGLSLKEQEAYIEGELALPYTTKVFSGGKSYHYVVSLDEPLATIERYREVAQWILDVAPRADVKCRNPSRFTRFGGGVRDNGHKQEIIEIRERVNTGTLVDFLRANVTKIAKSAEQREALLKSQQEQLIDPNTVPPGFRGRLTKRSLRFLETGAASGTRNGELHFAACDFKNNFYPLMEALERLVPVAQSIGLSGYEAGQTVRSAYRRAPLRPRL